MSAGAGAAAEEEAAMARGRVAVVRREGETARLWRENCGIGESLRREGLCSLPGSSQWTAEMKQTWIFGMFRKLGSFECYYWTVLLIENNILLS